jgi:hypothetical protein
VQHEVTVVPGIRLSLAWDDELPMDVASSHRCASGTLDIRLEPVGAQLRASREVVVEAGALEAFLEELERLLDALNGSATLEPVLAYRGHGDFAITMTLMHGKGAVSGFLAARYHQARLTFDGVEVDQSYLQETRRQLGTLLAAR